MCSRNRVSDRSRCGAVLSLRSLAQPSQHFGPDRSHCGAVLILIVKEILHRDLDKDVVFRELARRSCHGDLL